MTPVASHPPPTDVTPPISPGLGWRVLLAGAVVCGLVGVVGIVVDVGAVAGQSAEMKERLEWTKPRPEYPTGSPGERARLMAEIGRQQAPLLSTVRIALVAVALFVVVGGLWLRYTDWRAWLVAAAAGGFGGFGLPPHWDSIRMVVWVAAAGAGVGGGLTALSPAWRYSLLSAAALFHFGGTLASSTQPETYGRPGPWVSSQATGRVYHGFKQFAYLTNAYHFYSPDPGPASKFTLLIEYEIEDPADPSAGKKTTAEWVELPRRRENYKDPLGLTYYRRLSITELASYSTVGTQMPPSWEKGMAMTNRMKNEAGGTRTPRVPGATTSFTEMDLAQYRVPAAGVRHTVYPSYARHIADEYSGRRKGEGGKEMIYTVTKVKMFRMEHRILEAAQFLDYPDPERVREWERQNPGKTPDWKQIPQQGGIDPYRPDTYMPFYLGEYDRDGNLTDPNDPLLFWYLPVRTPPPDYATNTAVKWDWMSEYTGRKFEWRGRE